MKNEHSWTRQHYELVYRYMRRGFDYEFIAFNANGDKKAMQAADYAYQARDYVVGGWINDGRYNRFMVIKWRILSREEQIN